MRHALVRRRVERGDVDVERAGGEVPAREAEAVRCAPGMPVVVLDQDHDALRAALERRVGRLHVHAGDVGQVGGLHHERGVAADGAPVRRGHDRDRGPLAVVDGARGRRAVLVEERGAIVVHTRVHGRVLVVAVVAALAEERVVAPEAVRVAVVDGAAVEDLERVRRIDGIAVAPVDDTVHVAVVARGVGAEQELVEEAEPVGVVVAAVALAPHRVEGLGELGRGRVALHDGERVGREPPEEVAIAAGGRHAVEDDLERVRARGCLEEAGEGDAVVAARELLRVERVAAALHEGGGGAEVGHHGERAGELLGGAHRDVGARARREQEKEREEPLHRVPPSASSAFSETFTPVLPPPPPRRSATAAAVPPATTTPAPVAVQNHHVE